MDDLQSAPGWIDRRFQGAPIIRGEPHRRAGGGEIAFVDDDGLPPTLFAYVECAPEPVSGTVRHRDDPLKKLQIIV
jgi:hypothetical protein